MNVSDICYVYVNKHFFPEIPQFINLPITLNLLPIYRHVSAGSTTDFAVLRF